MSTFLTLTVPNITGIKLGIDVQNKILYYATAENSEWIELTSKDLLSQILVGPTAANKLIMTNNTGDNVGLIDFRLYTKYYPDEFPRTNAFPLEKVVYDFVNDVISNYFTKLEIESKYIPLPVEIIDNDSYCSATINTLSGGMIYTFTNPLVELNIDNIESSTKKTTINVIGLNDNLLINVPNTVEYCNNIPPEDIEKYVITIENNKLSMKYITISTDLTPIEGSVGYWIYSDPVQSGIINKDLDIGYETQIYNHGRLTNITNHNNIYVATGGVLTDVVNEGEITVLDNGHLANYTGSVSGILNIIGGIAYNIQADYGTITISNGILNTLSAVNNTEITVLSKGKLINGTILSGCSLIVSSTGIISNCNFSGAYCEMRYASAYDCSLSIAPNGGVISCYTGTYLKNVNIGSGTELQANAGGLGGTSNVFSTGALRQFPTAYTDENHVIQNMTLSTGAVRLFDGIRANNIQVSGYLHISSGAYGSNITVNKVDRGLILSAYGNAYNVNVSNGYLYYMGNTVMHTLGGSNTNIPISHIRYNNLSTGIIDSTISITNGVVNNLTLINTTSNIARLVVNSELLVNSGTIESGGCLYLRDGGRCSNIEINSNGSSLICDNANALENITSIEGNRGTCSCTNMLINSGGYTLFRGSNIIGSNITINSVGSAKIQNGVNITSLTINNGGSALIERNDLYIDNQFAPTINNMLINSGANVTIGSDAIINNISVGSDAKITPNEGALIINMNLVSGAICDINASEEVNSGAKIEGSNTNAPEGTLYYMGKPLAGNISNGVITNLGHNGAYYRVQIGSDIVIKDPKLYSGCRIYGQSNCIISGGNVYTSGNIGLLFEAKGYNIVVGGAGISKATYNLFNNAQAYNTTVYNGGYLQLQSPKHEGEQSYSSKSVIHSGGIMRLHDGTYAEDITVNIDGSCTISSGGVASNVVMNSGGSLIVSSGGSALGVTSNAGAIIINDGYIEFNS